MTDDMMLAMLLLRDEGKDTEGIAAEMGLPPAVIGDTLKRIDRDLARSERA